MLINLVRVFVFILLPGIAFSQNNLLISGKVMDKNNKPIENAKISFLKNDSSIIVATFSDKIGFYKVFGSNEVKFIKAEMQAFNSEIKNYNGTSANDFVLFESINKTIKEVTIVAKKPLVEYKADKTIFNVENSITATGGDAMDAIKRAPGVMVARNEINIAGKSSVAVMIDGRLQQLSSDDLAQMLHSIPADNISKIEVITSPSAKYDAEGNAGIINLILKKNKQKGFKGSVTAGHEYNVYGPMNFPTASTSLNYKKDKLNLFCNANGGSQGWNYVAYTNSYYPNSFSHQDVRYPYINPYARLQLGGDYTINKKSTIGFMASEGFSWLNNKESIIGSSYDLNNHLDSNTNTIGKTTDKYLGKLTTNLNYEYRFDSTGKKMNIDIDYFRQKGEKHREVMVENSIPISSFISQTLGRVTGSPLTEIVSAKVDVEIPTKNVKWNFGIKASDSQNELNNLYETKIGKEYVNDTTRTNQFSYHEEIEAAYISANKSIKKFEFVAGLRVEHSRGMGSGLAVQTFTIDYTKFFPSAIVQYKLNEKHNFNLTFARRISRPNYTFLNPFKFYYTPNTYVVGNPTLQPSFNYLTKLGYAYQSNINVSLLYNNITNVFDRVYTIDTLLKTNAVSRQNLGHKQVLALEIDYSIQPAKWWEITGNINGGHVLFNPTNTSNKVKFNAFNWWAEITNNFYLNKKKTLSTEISAFYYSPRQRDVVYWAAMKNVNFGIRYQMLNKNLTIAFVGEDIFATSYWLQTNKLNNTVEYSYDGHSYRISISYKFGNKNIKAKQVRSMEEIQRAGTSN
jgi:hypothetical protein